MGSVHKQAIEEAAKSGNISSSGDVMNKTNGRILLKNRYSG
jgi:hypothetical protein